MSGSVLDVFAEAYRGVSGHPHIVRNAAEAAAVVAEVIASANARCVATAQLPADVQGLVEQLCAERGIRLLKEPYSTDTALRDIDTAQVGISGAAFGIADTGTLVEVATDDAQRLVSSLPRTYIGVIDGRAIVPAFRDASNRLREIFTSNARNFAVSFISGPSRTGDIEMILTLGVHGPEIAHAIVIAGDAHA